VAVVNHFRAGTDDPLILADLRRNPWRYWRVLRTVRATVVHYHHSRWSTLVATAWALRSSPGATVATVHGGELEPFLRSRIPGIAALTRWSLRRFDVVIAVSSEIEQSLRTAVGHPVALIPAYLPAPDDQATLSPDAEAFLRQGTSLLMSAYRLTVDGGGRTIYGLETAIGSFASVARSHPELRLAIFIASAPRSRRESHLLRRLVREAGAEDVRRRIGVFFGEPLVPALRLAAIYLRPTRTDGDAVSVREALAAGVPVLTSDVVRRPPGVCALPLDRSRWAHEIDTVLTHGSRPPGGGPAADPLQQLIDIYARLRPRAGRGAEPVLIS
jgi:glycosyltransferase involved in cell wall biosynthesis